MSTSNGQARVTRFFESLPTAAGIFVVLMALGTLSEWYAGVDPAGDLFPGGGTAMLPITCVLFVLSGAALALPAEQTDAGRYDTASSSGQRGSGGGGGGGGGGAVRKWLVPSRSSFGRLAIVLALGVAAIAITEGASWLLGRNIGLDLLLFPRELSRLPWEPLGRPRVSVLVGFLLASAGLITTRLDRRPHGVAEQWLGLGTAVAGFLGVIGHSFGVLELYAQQRYTEMPVSTAVAMCVLGLGIILSRRRGGLARLLADSGAAGTVTRRLVPAAVLVPFILGWGRVFGERSGWYDTAAGVSLYVLANIAILLWLVSWAANMALQSDWVREQSLAREQAAREAAEGANLAKGNFLAVMSHELRTPLSAIIGYEELLADGITGPVSEPQKHQLARIKASAQHLLQLIDQILSYSRIEAGREMLQMDEVDANELASDAASIVEPLAEDKGLALETGLCGYALPMLTDSGKVRQILVNLLSNAIKFTPSGQVRIAVEHDAGNVRYVVSDSGIGIAPEHRERIFDAFWQVEQPSTRRVGGTGLGLSVTRRLAVLLGGDVELASVVGEGSTFTVTLPLEAPASERTELAARAAARIAGGIGVG